MFELDRVYAYTVLPQRNADTQLPTFGGPADINDDLRKVLAKAFKKIVPANLTTVQFVLDKKRFNATRDDVITLAFGNTAAPNAAVGRMAQRLAESMDNRSHPTLFLGVSEKEATKRRVSLLLLPQAQVASLGGNRDRILLNMIENAYNTQGGLQKVARMTGHNGQNQFIAVDVLDLQLTSQHKDTADFWLKKFLNAQTHMDGKAGTRKLAEGLQRAFNAAGNDEHDDVFAAMFKAMSGKVKRTSLTAFAKDLPPKLQPHFFSGISAEVRQTTFEVDRAFIKECLGQRVITGADGVVISAPPGTVGHSVLIDASGEKRKVSYSGIIEQERVARKAVKAKPDQKPNKKTPRKPTTEPKNA